MTTPVPGSSESIDTHWDDIADNYERIYVQSGGSKSSAGSSDLKELFEKRLNRPIGESVVSRFGIKPPGEQEEAFHFDVDAELIVFGNADPTSSVVLSGEPVKLGADGSFTVRMDLLIAERFFLVWRQPPMDVGKRQSSWRLSEIRK